MFVTTYCICISLVLLVHTLIMQEPCLKAGQVRILITIIIMRMEYYYEELGKCNDDCECFEGVSGKNRVAHVTSCSEQLIHTCNVKRCRIYMNSTLTDIALRYKKNSTVDLRTKHCCDLHVVC